MEIITKKQFILMILKWIEERSTRRFRGTTENKYLLDDLESIERDAKHLKEIIESEKEEYTWFETEKIKNKWMSDHLKEVGKEQKN